jgi:hypothetical protein
MRGLTIQPTTMDEVLAEVVRQRGNQLILLDTPEWAVPGGPSARWMHCEGLKIDLVWHHPSLPSVLRDQVLGHETGHMVEGHRPAPIDFQMVERAITSNFKHVDQSLVESALARNVFDEDRERDAEHFADWVNGWVSRNQQPAPGLLSANVRASLEGRSEYW